MILNKKLLTVAAVSLLGATAVAADNVFDIQVNKPGVDIAPTMYGHFFEDINYAADGGLYAEMVKNRSFEFPDRLMGWRSFGKVAVKDDGPFERNPHYVTLIDPGHRDKRTGLDNEGFFGVAFKKGDVYRFSVWARSSDKGDSKIRVELIDPASDGETQVCAHKSITIDSREWKKYTIELTPDQTIAKGRLRIFLASPNPVDLEHISLFPKDTYNGHENGLRRDLAELLAATKPGIFRFPGGCIVEGTEVGDRYQWKNTVGPVENRPLNLNRWEYTFPHRYYPDYFQSGGLGFYEYFLLAEELGAAPLPVLNVGLVCQYQNGTEAHVPVTELQEYIQDALDLIEFANGGTDTKWGALRAEMGHPAPFGLKYLAIGNEQWGPEYVEHLAPFVKELRAKHPEIEIVGSSGPGSEGKDFDYLWPEMKKLKVDLVDEHFYRNQDWFLSQGNRYDKYDRKGPKVFAGEYACHTKGHGNKRNNFYAALCEAAFMTGLERNADVVRMATYAPLFAHVEGWQWRPDLIWFDNLRSVPSASYYVQKLYGENKGTRVIPLTMAGKAVAGNEGQNGLFASAALDEPSGRYIVKVANTSAEPQTVTLNFKGMKKGKAFKSAEITTLSAKHDRDENTLDDPTKVMPSVTHAPVEGSTFTVTLAPHSFDVINLSDKPYEPQQDYYGYLFTYFTGNDKKDESVHYALSRDGMHFRALNRNRPIIDSEKISETGGIRDPHILRTEDGNHYYMVVTDMVSANGWSSNRGLTLLKSDDLVNWTPSVINIRKRFPGNEDLLRVWAPQTIYDHEAGKYMVYWSMKHGDGPDIIYYAYANDDFTDFIGEPKPLFIPADKKSCIDGDIVYKDGVYHMFYKTEGHGNGIKKATTKSLTSGKWVESPDYKQQTDKAVEGAGTFKLIGTDDYVLMYDVYMDGKYQFTRTSDLENFKVIDSDISMDFHPRHGTVLPITEAEYKRLQRAFK